jgi:hypothetical protein
MLFLNPTVPKIKIKMNQKPINKYSRVQVIRAWAMVLFVVIRFVSDIYANLHK